MKYKNEIKINLPVAKVIELFDNPDNLKHWQPGLISFEHLSGTPGQPGAKSKLTFQHGKNKREMIETVTVRNLPKEFSGTYEMNGAWCSVRNFFEKGENNATIYKSETEFRLSGFLKVIGWLIPGGFKKQTQKFLENFKAFAEKQ